MTIEQLTYLAEGLSVSACGQTLAIDRMRVGERRGGVDVAFRIAGTDLAPRIRLSRDQLETSTWDEMASVLRHVTCRAAGACRP